MKTLANSLNFITHMNHYGYDFFYSYREWKYEPMFIYAVDKMSKTQLLELLVDPSQSTRAIAALKLQLGAANE